VRLTADAAELVVDPDGALVPHARVVAERPGTLLTYAADVPDGRFRLGPLAPGAYRLTAGMPGGPHLGSAALPAEAGAEDLKLVLQPGGFLRGVVVDATTGAPATASIRVAVVAPGTRTIGGLGGAQLAAPEFELGGLPLREHAVVARTADGRAGVVRALPSPALAAAPRLELAVAPGARLALRVADGDAGGFYSVWWGDVLVDANGLGPGGRVDPVVPAGDLVVDFRPRGATETAAQDVVGSPGVRSDVVLGR
jgi:hypothetical protein